MRLVVRSTRLKPTAKNTVGGTTSWSSLIRNARRRDLGMEGFLRISNGMSRATRAYQSLPVFKIDEVQTVADKAAALQGQSPVMGMSFSERNKNLFAGHLRRDFLS